MTRGLSTEGAGGAVGDDVPVAVGAPQPISVRYGEHPDQVADVFVPSSEPTGTLLIVLHGGFWRASVNRDYVLPMAAALASEGHSVVVPEFRRVGQSGGGWPGTLDDVALAVDRGPALHRQLRGNRPEIRALVVVGHSSGGHLAAWSAARSLLPEGVAWARSAPAVTGAVCLSGAVDLGLAHELGLGEDAASEFLGGGPAELPERYALADPARLRPAVPVVLLHPEQDPIVPIDLARAYVSAGSASGADVTLQELPGDDHFEATDPKSASWPQVVAAIGRVATRRAAAWTA
jgi:acetyl esterase/lipase